MHPSDEVSCVCTVDQSCDETLVVECGAGGRYPDWQPLGKKDHWLLFAYGTLTGIVHILKHAKIIVLSHSPTRAFNIESGYQSSTLVPFVLVGQSTRSSRKMHIRDGAGYQILVIKTPKSEFLIMSIGNSFSYQPDSDSIDLVSQSPPWYSLRMRGRKLNFRKMHIRDGARYQPGD
jgi:hypothetical protein